MNGREMKERGDGWRISEDAERMQRRVRKSEKVQRGRESERKRR